MDLDHLAVTCADLEQGVAWASDALGVPFQSGGQHSHYGTHNHLLGLGPDLYMEVIAPDPAALLPTRPRWFGLDHAAAPALTNWIVRTADLAARPDDAGEVVALERGDLRWQITVPVDGSLCLGGAYPSLIRWTAGAHPATRLTDHGVRLTRLQVHHPDPGHLAALLKGLTDDRVSFVAGPPGLSAEFATPLGLRWLG